MRVLLSLFLLLSIVSSKDLKVKELISGFNVIWGMDLVSEKELLFTTKDGKIYSLNLELNKTSLLKNLKNISYGQGGLMDIKVSPKFDKDRTIYFTHIKKIDSFYTIVLSKARYQNNELEDIKEVYVSSAKSDTSRHFGSRIAFDKNNNLYFSIGDRGIRDLAQDLSVDAGSIIRVDTKGKAKIFSFGHRNPQGLFYDKKKDLLFSVEHGPRGGDEVNIIKENLNYGWPIVSYGKEYWNPMYVGDYRTKKGYEDAIKVYTPSIAPSSIIVYNNNYYPILKNKVLVSALKAQHISVLSFDKNNIFQNEVKILENLHERIRSLAISKNGIIYFSSDSGKIYKLLNK